MEEIGVEECESVIPRVLGSKDRKVNEFGVLVSYPVPDPFASEKFELLQSRVHLIMTE